MDGIVNAAWQKLVKDDDGLARLRALLQGITPAQRDVDTTTKQAIAESLELLQILHTWVNGQKRSAPALDDETLNDDDAMMLMANADELSNDEASARVPASGNSDNMSDDEAQALLAAMDAPTTPAPSSEDMSDDEARALLASMDSPVAATTSASSPTTSSKASGDMDDEEARALLAAMDAPLTTPASANTTAGNMSAQGTSAVSAQTASASSSEPKAAAHTATASGGHDKEVVEINEWEPNDFQTDPDMVNDFIVNSDQLLVSLDEALLRLEQDPRNLEIIEEIFRAAHTFKGGSGMFGFKGIERVMHSMENLFDLIRKGKLVPSSNTIDVVFQGMDLLRVLLEAVRAGKPCGAKTAHVVHNLILASQGKDAVVADRGTTDPAPANKAADTSGHHGDAESRLPAAPAPGPHDAAAKTKEQSVKKEQSAIRVDLDRLDALVNLVGELVIDRTRFLSMEQDIRASQSGFKLAGHFAETLQLFGRHMNEIQDIIMKVRMVPVGSQFNRYTRIVRDLAKQLGKKIDLVISGESAELDKTIVEQIGDPLIHLIRNSCDHGVELPDVRVAAGKAATGRIELSAYQEGNQIIITIADDGKGIPVDIIRRKAIEKGLITDNDHLSESETLALIFEPGFSTAEKVTEISGRGVGMDVVKKQIQKLKGHIDIESKPGRGTTMRIRLPLTLAIVQSLLVEVEQDIYAVPLASVIESIHVDPAKVQLIGGEEVVRLRDRVLPLLRLKDVLGLSTQKSSLIASVKANRQANNAVATRKTKRDKVFIVVAGSPSQPFGIVVDQLLSQTEMVIKSMGPLMQNIPCIAGGALLGHGEVVVVLDMQELEARFRSTKRGKMAA